LNRRHARELRATLTRHAEAGRKVTGPGGRPARTRKSTSAGSSKEMRDWAREHGYEVNDRGLVPADVVPKYEAASGE